MKTKFISCILSAVMAFSITSTVFAQGSNINQVNSQGKHLYEKQKYSVQDVKNLKPYVSVKSGKFVFATKEAKADNVDIKLINGQVQYFTKLNKMVDSDEIKINKDLTIIPTQSNNIHSATELLQSKNMYSVDDIYDQYQHWHSCGGGTLTTYEYHWWGYSRYLCDCLTQKIAADFSSAAVGGFGSVAVSTIKKWFGPLLMIEGAAAAGYCSLYSSRLTANNQGHGVYIEITWLLLFDVTPQ